MTHNTAPDPSPATFTLGDTADDGACRHCLAEGPYWDHAAGCANDPAGDRDEHDDEHDDCGRPGRELAR